MVIFLTGVALLLGGAWIIGTDYDRSLIVRYIGFTNLARPPAKISDNLYYVGARDIASYLLVGQKGHILIDAGYAETVEQILDNINSLGFDPKDIKYILITHSHDDHAGGANRLKKLTGGRLVAGERDGEQLQSGGKGDYHFVDDMRFTPVQIDLAAADGDQIVLGNLLISALSTPGHTKGCTSWSFNTTIESREFSALLPCSVSRLGSPLKNNQNYPEIAQDYESSINRLLEEPCEIWLMPHGLQFGLRVKANAAEDGDKLSFVDPSGCRQFLLEQKSQFLQELRES